MLASFILAMSNTMGFPALLKASGNPRPTIIIFTPSLLIALVMVANFFKYLTHSQHGFTPVTLHGYSDIFLTLDLVIEVIMAIYFGFRFQRAPRGLRKTISSLIASTICCMFIMETSSNDIFHTAIYPIYCFIWRVVVYTCIYYLI